MHGWHSSSQLPKGILLTDCVKSWHRRQMSLQGAGLCSASSTLTPCNPRLTSGRSSSADTRLCTSYRAYSLGSYRVGLLRRPLATCAVGQRAAPADSGRSAVCAGAPALHFGGRCQVRRNHDNAAESRSARKSAWRPTAMAAGGSGTGTGAAAYQPPIEELAQDAVVWASQHGLVRPRCTVLHLACASVGVTSIAVESIHHTQFQQSPYASLLLSASQLVGVGPPAPEAAVVHAPLAVLPAPFPAASFRKACEAATAFNSLIAAVAADSEYLQRTLAPAAKYDDFTVRGAGNELVWIAPVALRFSMSQDLR